MSLKKKITPYVVELMLSDFLKRLKRGWFDLQKSLYPSLNRVTFYHRLNDPYSYLLLQCLPKVVEQYKLSISVEFVLNLPSDFNPEQKKLTAYSLKDAAHLAKKHHLLFPVGTEQPSLSDTFKATACLLKQKELWSTLKDPAHFLQLLAEVTSALWGHSTTTLESCSKRYGCLSDMDTQTLLDAASKKLQLDGHYMSAMLNYGGEWYWGVDRLNHLTARLERKVVRQQDLHLDSLPKVGRKHSHPIDFYFSFRSPYSYLAAEKLFKLADQYQLEVNIKPVMPMVMRGFQIPRVKKMYIVDDVKREADLNHIPFGKICDPVGEGVERSLSLFYYAKQEGKERSFISSITQGIWAEGMDVCNDKVMDRLLTRAGLDWNNAKSSLESNNWKQQVEKNRKDLTELGLWGVPCFKYKQLVLWGQDRLWVLEEAIREGEFFTK